MPITARDFSSLVGKLNGFSPKQLEAHLGLYRGYVNKYNEIVTKLATADRSAGNYSFNEFSELRRREVVAFNGSYLHELYFENMTGGANSKPNGTLMAKMERDFGSFDAWDKDIRACAASTPGWVLLTHSRTDDKLHHFIVFEHHIGLPVHQEPVLALDCWEHAYMIDFSTDKASYVTAFLNNVDWNIVNNRLVRAEKMAAVKV